MTSHEAYELIKQSKHSVRNYKLIVAIDIALKALAWQCAHEKMKKLCEEKHNENKHI